MSAGKLRDAVYEVNILTSVVLEENERLRQENSRLKSKSTNRKKLSQREVNSIRELHRNGWSQKAIADSYDINPATVSRIVRGIYHTTS
jgi:DNA-binding NarL/FixJ family response regulator